MSTHCSWPLNAVFAVPLLFGAPASAQDLYGPPVWTGVYAGLLAGQANIDLDIADNGGRHVSAPEFGALAGFNFQFGAAVAGLEADVTKEDLSRNFAIDLSVPGYGTAAVDLVTSITSSATVRARAGVVAGPMLFYATAGAAWARLDAKASANGLSADTEALLTGFVYGGGAEAVILPNVGVRLEALKYEFPSETLSGGISGSNATIDGSGSVIRGALTFRFN